MTLEVLLWNLVENVKWAENKLPFQSFHIGHTFKTSSKDQFIHHWSP